MSMFTLSMCLASFVALTQQVSGFTVTPNQRILSSKQILNNVIKFQRCGLDTKSVIGAIVFYPEGDDGSSDNEDDNEFASTHLSSELRERHQDLADKLSSNKKTLAHLASAFSPAGQPINLEQINSVRCTAVDNKHLDIETVLCDDLECNSLLVPIDFPNECTFDSEEDSSSLLEDCVMTNVEELDHEWESRLQTLASATELLHNAPSFPEWWIPPNTKEDISECELLIDLMNEDDMVDERIGLCRKVYNPSKLDDIKSVKVLAISPAGVLLKVVVSEDNVGDITESTIPVKFNESTRSIREEVIELLSSAGVN